MGRADIRSTHPLASRPLTATVCRRQSSWLLLAREEVVSEGVLRECRHGPDAQHTAEHHADDGHQKRELPADSDQEQGGDKQRQEQDSDGHEHTLHHDDSRKVWRNGSGVKPSDHFWDSSPALHLIMR
ncbi:MAG: hypothetical protein JWP06_570 [Candidatus Saccharibacteria bacterium]|nr:hypothetical protein [Candidatus Saccharibacteria bacterium]